MDTHHTTLLATAALLTAAVGAIAQPMPEGLDDMTAAEPAATRVEVVELTTSNDIISGNDDLYTARVEIEARLAGRQLVLGERMFTDRAAGVRHDESFAELVIDLEPAPDVTGTASVGALRVGEGFLGESFQNSVHSFVGGDRMGLAYPDDTRWYPTARLGIEAPLTRRPRGSIKIEGEAFTAVGFRSSLQVAVAYQRAISSALTGRVEVGAMSNHVQTQLLSGHVRELVPTWKVGIEWHGMEIVYSANSLGTRQRHLTVGYRLGWSQREAG
jgi:hypothetical protein